VNEEQTFDDNPQQAKSGGIFQCRCIPSVYTFFQIQQLLIQRFPFLHTHGRRLQSGIAHCYIEVCFLKSNQIKSFEFTECWMDEKYCANPRKFELIPCN
jgi:hypothetical protein